jgi:hypothetical protein
MKKLREGVLFVIKVFKDYKERYNVVITIIMNAFKVLDNYKSNVLIVIYELLLLYINQIFIIKLIFLIKFIYLNIIDNNNF